MKNMKGTVKFVVPGQKAKPRWEQEQLRAALNAGSTPESLRFQCAIALAAREGFKEVPLSDGEVFTIHESALPQFGKNSRGLPYLTVTGTYSGDGRNYCAKWEGDAVPKVAQRVAVKHDLGKYVKRAVPEWDWAEAQIRPSTAGVRRGDIEPKTGKIRKRRDGTTGGKKTGRKVRCAGRICEGDL